MQSRNNGVTTSNVKSTTFTLTSNWQLVKVENAILPSGANQFSAACYLTSAGSFNIDALQLEEGSVATTWHPPYSGATSFNRGQMPMPIVNPNEGTIEFDFNADSMSKRLVNYNMLFYAGFNLDLFHIQGNSLWGCDLGLNCQDMFTVGICRIVLKWSKSNIKIVVNGTVLSVLFSPVLPTMLIDLLYMGTENSITSNSNTIFGNIRISNIARPDSELANNWNQALTADKYTTWLTNFDERLANIVSA